jgi:hypothetical protein
MRHRRAIKARDLYQQSVCPSPVGPRIAAPPAAADAGPADLSLADLTLGLPTTSVRLVPLSYPCVLARIEARANAAVTSPGAGFFLIRFWIATASLRTADQSWAAVSDSAF